MEELRSLFNQAVKNVFPDYEGGVDIMGSTKEKYGEYQFVSAKKISAQYGIESYEAAVNIANHLPENGIIDRVEVRPHGGINVYLTKEYLISRLNNILVMGVLPPPISKKKIVIDFSSPNIAKVMHVGHLRSTIIGDCLARLFEFLGHEVLRINHIGDWGTQFGMLIAHLKSNPSDEEMVIEDLQQFYKEAKARFKEDEAFQKIARECVVKLQSGDEETSEAWKLICDISRESFEDIYRKLDIVLEEKGESFYQPLMPLLVEELEEAGHVTVEDGRKLVYIPDLDLPLTVEKSDGGYTYDTSDLTALKYRLIDEGADQIIYVVDSGQKLHFDQIFEVARMMGWVRDGVSLNHVNFGLVLDKETGKRIRSSDGGSEPLINCLNAALDKAAEIFSEKREEGELSTEESDKIISSVAYNSVKYADLFRIRTKNYVYDVDAMLNMKGDTAGRLMYAYTRIRAIGRKSKLGMDGYLGNIANLEHENEIRLAKYLLKFYDAIDLMMKKLCPHYLCKYLYELSNVYNDFFSTCRSLYFDENENLIKIDFNRYLLCQTTEKIMKKGFDILGLFYVKRM